jgi:hypothetical protein
LGKEYGVASRLFANGGIDPKNEHRLALKRAITTQASQKLSKYGLKRRGVGAEHRYRAAGGQSLFQGRRGPEGFCEAERGHHHHRVQARGFRHWGIR